MVDSKDNCCKMMYDAMLEGYALLKIMKNADNEPYDYSIIEINKKFEAIVGVSRNEVIGKTVGQALPEFGESWFKISKSVTQTEAMVQFEFCFEKIDRYFLISAFNLSCDKIIIFITETTLQKKAKDAFRLHEILFENAQDIMLYIKFDGQIVNANKRACEQYGYTKQQLLSMRIQDIRHPSTVSEYEQQMQQADNEGTVFECIHVRSNGSSFPVEVSAKSTYTQDGRFRIHIIRDITKRKENEEKIAWLAKYDALTGIPNRANFIIHLEEEVQRSMRNGTHFAVMLFDVDKFKYINDHYGHETGDVVLRHVAQAAQKVLRATDQIGRFGGDEFVVLQTGIKGYTDIDALAKRIQTAVNETITHEAMQVSVKISIGISLFPEDAIDANSLLHCADKAMYQVKRNGGGAYCFFTPCNPPCTENRLCLDKNVDMENNEL